MVHIPSCMCMGHLGITSKAGKYLGRPEMLGQPPCQTRISRNSASPAWLDIRPGVACEILHSQFESNPVFRLRARLHNPWSRGGCVLRTQGTQMEAHKCVSWFRLFNAGSFVYRFFGTCPCLRFLRHKDGDYIRPRFYVYCSHFWNYGDFIRVCVNLI